jgi:hypothetical protein
MEPAIPNGARIRIRSAPQDSWRIGQVIVFLAGSRIAAHRIVHAGQGDVARHFVLTHGDNNWLCDPPVNRSTIVGGVEEFSTGGEWQAVGVPKMPFYRRIVARASLALMRRSLEWSPAFAIRLSRPMTWLRMGPRRLVSKLRRLRTGHVRH